MRRLLAAVLLVVCAAGVVAYQATRPTAATSSPRVFVPSPRFFGDFSPSYRTSIADAYYLWMVQYYGQHLNSDRRFDSLPAMVRLTTTLSPHFKRAYFFGAFALIDAGRPDVSYEVLQEGFKANPRDWHFPSYLGFFVYTFGEKGEAKDRVAASWYRKAAAIPGSPSYLPRLAARLLEKGGERQKALVMWGQVYADGDKYSREKAVAGLLRVLPAPGEAQQKALKELAGMMPASRYERLISDLQAAAGG